MEIARAGEMNVSRIFCAEDDDLLREVLVKLFTARGHLIVAVSNGTEAWSLLATNAQQYDVIVSDHQMPGLSGLALVERLRGSGYAGRIVIYSSSISSALAAVYRGFGVSAIVPKSSRPDQLIASVEAQASGLNP
ncbi:MAG TPA: response regulator [Opitutaceae bacterium]|nr:response regulator [Opitutaceae bacterium]